VRPGARGQSPAYRRRSFRWSATARSHYRDPTPHAITFAASRKGVEDGGFWSSEASDNLRDHFHVAALAGYDLRRQPRGCPVCRQPAGSARSRPTQG
jgi:hypothetical protein